MIISPSDYSTLPQYSSTKETSMHGQILQNPNLKTNTECNIRKSDPNLNSVSSKLNSTRV